MWDIMCSGRHHGEDQHHLLHLHLHLPGETSCVLAAILVKTSTIYSIFISTFQVRHHVCWPPSWWIAAPSTPSSSPPSRWDIMCSGRHPGEDQHHLLQVHLHLPGETSCVLAAILVKTSTIYSKFISTFQVRHHVFWPPSWWRPTPSTPSSSPPSRWDIMCSGRHPGKD